LQTLRCDRSPECPVNGGKVRRVGLLYEDLRFKHHDLHHYRFGIPVCPHAGGVGLCQYTIHLRHVFTCMILVDLTSSWFSLIDYIAISGSIDKNVLESVLSVLALQYWAVAYGPLLQGDDCAWCFTGTDDFIVRRSLT